jgi:hypothetical protein
MIKKTTIIISLVIAIILFFVGKYSLWYLQSQPFFLKPILQHENKYEFLFDSAIRQDLHACYSAGNFKTNEFIFAYTYLSKFRYIIIEEKNLQSINPHFIRYSQIVQDDTKEDINPSSGCEIDCGPSLKIDKTICLDFKSTMSITFNTKADVEIIDSLQSRSFSGVFKQVLFKNDEAENELLFTFDQSDSYPSWLTCFQSKNSFYIILVNSFDNKTRLSDGIKLLRIE